MNIRYVLAVLFAAVVIDGCAASSTAVNTSFSTAPAPHDLATVGKPTTATARNGGQARITLTTVRYLPDSYGDPSVDDAVFTFTIAGLTAKPFAYDAEMAVATYDGADLFDTGAHPLGEMGSADINTNYSALHLIPLRSGSITRGKTKQGSVVIEIPIKTRYLLGHQEDRIDRYARVHR